MRDTKAFRNDAIAKVTGTAKYTDDYTLPRMLHAAPLHAPMASAWVKSIDYSKALKCPGVVAVFTALDIPGKIRFGQIIKDYPTLVHDRIRSTGDVLALVVANTRDQALAAAGRVPGGNESLRHVQLFNPGHALHPQ